jgi:hypothetical protein
MKMTLVALSLLLGACTKQNAQADPEVVRPVGFAAWMPADAERAWQGAWASRLTLRPEGAMSMEGDPAALDIRGTTARVFDGTREHQLGFEITAPCEVQFSRVFEDGAMKGTAYYGVQYVIRDGALVAGHGAAGYRRGRAAIVCARGIHVLDASGACTSWERLATWRERPETCVWSREDGKDVLTIGTGDWAIEVAADGDLLVDEQFRHDMAGGVHRRAVDYADAMRAVMVATGAR